jgi:pilus assembly protein CpaB
MKSRNILIAALIMAVVTTILFRQYLSELDKKYKKAQNKVSIVVSNQNIAKNQKITKEMLKVKEISADSVHPEAVRKVEDLIGDYALTDIIAGEELFDSRFTNQFEEDKLITRKIQEGFRAIAIEVNYVESVSNLIGPEDYVDVVFTEKTTANTVESKTLLENVRVLAVGKKIIENEAASKSLNNTTNKDVKAAEALYNSVTVELKPEDVIKLANSDEKGNIKFVLRSKIANK